MISPDPRRQEAPTPWNRSGFFGGLGRTFGGLAFSAFAFGIAGGRSASRGGRSRGGSRGRCRGCSRSGGLLFLLRGLFVVFAAIIGAIKARPFKNEAASRADLSLHFAFAPFFLTTKFFGAGRKRFVGDGLILFKFMPALGTHVFVGWHCFFMIWRPDTTKHP